MLTLLIVLLIIAFCFGGYGHGRDGWGYYGWSPLGVLVIVALVLWLTGALH